MKAFLKKIIVFIITLEARAVLFKYKPEIIAVTGSVGKTSAKDAIFTVLSSAAYVWRGEKSFNSEIGIPLTILGCKNAWSSVSGWIGIVFEGLGLMCLKNHYPRMLVIEVGVDRPGDMRRITSWLKPDVVVVTAFPEVPVHIEFFHSRETLIKEKMFLIEALKDNGLLALNADDAEVVSLKQAFSFHVRTFGVNPHADVSATQLNIEYDAGGRPVGMFGKVAYQGNTLPLRMRGVIGAHLFLSMLSALAVGVEKGINIVLGVESLARAAFPPGRMRILEGVRGSTVIDDSYNSSPHALSAALSALAEIKRPTVGLDTEWEGRKIAVLGDMLELGKYSAEEHKKIGVRIPEICDALITVGIRAHGIARAAQQKKMKKANMHHFENSILAGEFLKTFLRQGDVVLVKGSESMRMERAVERILQNAEDKKLLVRQEKEWISR